VSNADLIHGAAILVVMPAALYLTSGWGFSSSKKLFLILARFIGENPGSEEYVELMKEVMDKEEGVKLTFLAVTIPVIRRFG